MDALRLLAAYGRAMSAQTALLEAQLALLVELAAAPEAPSALPCPHPEEARIDLATLGHPRRFACRVCGITVDDMPQEVSHGSAHG